MRKKEIRKLGRYKNYLKYLSHVRISTINTANRHSKSSRCYTRKYIKLINFGRFENKYYRVRSCHG